MVTNSQQNLLSVVLGVSVSIATLAPMHSVFADSSISNWHEDPLQLNVKFARRTSAFTQQDQSASGDSSWKSNWMSEFDNLTSSPQNTKYSLDSKLLRQYDATFFYPFQKGKFNFDLGLNIKFISGISETSDALGTVSTQAYNATLPMMYATALYELPWKGVSAGIEGKHMIVDSSRAYDYKAMLTYKSRSGFGLNGGWQYQQLHLDAFQNITTSSETDGPFVDVFYNF